MMAPLPPDGLHEPQALALHSGLEYVSDEAPGIRRRRCGRGFSYLSSDGLRIKDVEVLQRIHELAVPPAWSDVWICSLSLGHLQATGKDDRRRKQYRYHPLWMAAANRAKFERLAVFAEALPKIRRAVQKDIQRKGFKRERIVAAVIAIIDRTFVRIGNREYAEANKSYGITTLTQRHVEVEDEAATFRFRGKSGRMHVIEFEDRRLASILEECFQTSGDELFQYCDDDGDFVPVTSTHVNEYLQDVTGKPFTAKDFRTWHGSVIAAASLMDSLQTGKPSGMRRKLSRAIRSAADALGNTVTTCRKYYVHPAILESFANDEWPDLKSRFRPRRKHPLDRNEQWLRLLLRSG